MVKLQKSNIGRIDIVLNCIMQNFSVISTCVEIDPVF